MQFKKSKGLTGYVPTGTKRRINEDKMQSIRRFRHKHELCDNPTLFFGLHPAAENAYDFQHNILLAHNRPNRSHAIYVAPLELDKQRYSEALYKSPPLLRNPWDMQTAEVLSDAGHRAWLSRYAFLPFLRAHISIAPHERVDTHEHFYAYSTSGDQVTWHSPSVVPGGPFRLSDFMSARTRQIIASEDGLPSPAQALEVGLEFLSQYGVDERDVLFGETPFECLRDYGRWLRREFGLRQFLLCANKEHTDMIRKTILR